MYGCAARWRIWHSIKHDDTVHCISLQLCNKAKIPLCCAGDESAGDVKGPVVFSKSVQYEGALTDPADRKAAITLATASGRGASPVRAYEGETGRQPEGMSAGGASVEPDLVADSLSMRGADTQATAPISANAHNNAEAEPVQAPQPEDVYPPTLVVAVAPAPKPAKAATAGSANAHNNSDA